MKNRIIRIGTRKSALAVAQTELVADLLKRSWPQLAIELVGKQTEGDRILEKPLLEFGGKGVFISEFEQALLQGDIEFAVHSAKDLPMDLEEGLGILAVVKRGDPRDVLIIPSGSNLSGKEEIVVGTSSLRRKIQIEEIGAAMWPGSKIRCENLRGNINTRLLKLSEGNYDAIILAAAGLERLKLQESPAFDFHYFDCETFIPAGGQGTLAIEGRLKSGNESLIKPIEDEDARLCLTLERKVLRLLNAGCHEPIGIYSRLREEKIEVFGILGRGDSIKRIHLWGERDNLDELALQAARALE